MTQFTDIRIFLCMTPTNMHYSFDGLMGQAQQIFDQDPCSGHLFLFLNRNRDRIKILFWDQDGFCIFYKRLEAGSFQLPRAANDPAGCRVELYPTDAHVEWPRPPDGSSTTAVSSPLTKTRGDAAVPVIILQPGLFLFRLSA